ncbi:ATP/GTP-binding protein [Streptomyces sp. NPDC020571]|uniref:ATP/GTP-binding protein n=1 Tax=Streptomyces sp. NPDC020571 TaxID=3365079 RepID=UPI00378A690C
MWVVCEADEDSSASGSAVKPAGSGKKKQAKPVCTSERMEPQPPADSMFWGDKSPEDGAVYQQTCLNGPRGTPVTQSVVLDEAPAAPAVDPEVVARQAVSKMKLLGPDIVSPRAAGRYTVGVPMWMLVDQTPTTYGPQTTSATADAVTVTATARVSSITWNMGDGSTVTCNGPGTPYRASEGMAQSPTCGHIYAKTSAGAQSNKFTITATSTWTVDWQGGGEAGEFTETRQSDVQVAVGELQVVR